MEEYEVERTGQVRKRYVNKARHVGFAPLRIGHGHVPGEVPMEPVKAVKDKIDKLDQGIMAKLRLVSLQSVSSCRSS